MRQGSLELRRAKSVFLAGLLASLAVFPVPFPAQQVQSGSAGDVRFPIAGSPPLTQEMVLKATRFFEWLLDSSLSPDQRRQFQDSLAQSWLSHRQDEIQSTVQIIQLSDQLGGKTASEREVYRQVLQPKFIAQMRSQPSGDLSRWVLGIYDQANKPLASGNPPLTQQVVDSYVAFLSFMAYQALGSNWMWKGSGSFHDAVAQPIIAGYPGMTADQQGAMAQIPLQWAVLNDQWPRATLAQKQQLCAQWRPAVQQFLDNLTQVSLAVKPANPAGSQDQLAHKVQQQTMVDNFRMNSMTQITNIMISGKPF